MSGNICRCGAYQGITEAVQQAQREISAGNRRDAA
jgi:xanthine dehydrogenase YagT iron-sulfur-binding subunit